MSDPSREESRELRQECDTRGIKEAKPSAVLTDGLRLSGRRRARGRGTGAAAA